MANKVNEYNYLIVYNYLKNGAQPISTNEVIVEEENDPGYLILENVDLTPEQKVIKNDEYQKLSLEAREIINIILHSPNEILNLFSTPKRKSVSIARLKKILTNLWKSELIVETAFEEVSRWVKKL